MDQAVARDAMSCGQIRATIKIGVLASGFFDRDLHRRDIPYSGRFFRLHKRVYATRGEQNRGIGVAPSPEE